MKPETQTSLLVQLQYSFCVLHVYDFPESLHSLQKDTYHKEGVTTYLMMASIFLLHTPQFSRN